MRIDIHVCLGVCSSLGGLFREDTHETILATCYLGCFQFCKVLGLCFYFLIGIQL